jgi:hypothetical protein
MNLRRFMGFLRGEGRTLAYRCARTVLCDAAKWAAVWPLWVKTRTPPQRAQVRCRQVRTLPWTLGDHVAEPAWAKRKAAEAAKAS